MEISQKLIDCTSHYPSLQLFCQCNCAEDFIKLHTLTNYSQTIALAIDLPQDPKEFKILSTLPLSALFVNSKHFEKNSIKQEFIPFLKEMTIRQIPIFVETDIPHFTFCFFSLGKILNDLVPTNFYGLSFPLLPLENDLNSMQYQKLEFDTAKYDLYEEFTRKALEMKGPDAYVAIVGAGRGPIVDRAVKAGAKNVIIVEKNVSAVILLKQRLEREWPSTYKLYEGDMRNVKLPFQIDIIVSELLGSFGDNELCPECLYGCNRFLSKDAISIPQNLKSFLVPINSHYLWCEAFHKSLDYIWVTSMATAIPIGQEKEINSFEFPSASKDFYNSKVFEFEADTDSTLNGFCGWFDSKLFEEIHLSNSFKSHTNASESWLHIYVPIRKPVNVKKGQIIKLLFSRRTDGRRVWYEWALVEPELMGIQNAFGCKYSINLFY
ncbi:capsuleen, putative [Trichomonas vaginalis G3]|uniref:Capsuleen, putative n=1 Tax=Trichomonas vaginalis (strain ATCC PRA-98 / G3) TaxID=412133 RepID=A2DMX1_TRIV3|nr:peptidyl-arginine methylation, to symmetrical-dimethyl arginine [Trichomonas vaginalis G3]EAY18342.1 capsuleen, putative [Trichomonas vaginalis G3]KAI5541828.1 peptidyl-arginine methylation, to symmetrical-dimethyl arginine [Trichomonas vaginalis G3]|eukprot:XP_001579328.1 capsuleen [Trichomonas vaginalis G3]